MVQVFLGGFGAVMTIVAVVFIVMYVTNPECDADTPIAPTPIEDKYGFVYPSSLVHPANFWLGFVAPVLHGTTVQKYETPIAVYQTMRLDQIMWNCIAAYHPSALDATAPLESPRRPPAVVNNIARHTSQNRVLCSAHAINALLVAGLNVLAIEPYQAQMAAAGLDTSVPMYTDVASDAPYFIGHKLAADMLSTMKDDGSNFEGLLDRWGNACPAKKRCPAYGDSGAIPRYEPVNNPWKMASEFPDKWKPQLESNELGFVQANGHVTPHFGSIETFIVNKAEHKSAGHDLPTSPYPADITSSLATTMDRVAGAAQDIRSIQTVKFFDNKINLAGGMIMRMRERFLMSFEEQVYYHVGYTTVEYDSVILAWEAKTKFDRARPTAYVNDEASGYSGAIMSFDGVGYGSIKASQWDAMIRVMPHAEYPSGSGCICTVVKEYVDKYVMVEHNVSAFKTEWDIGSNVTLTFQSMDALRNMCGDSRVDGGMHFEPAVTDSYQLCGGIGEKAFTDYVHKLLGGGGKFDDAFPEPVAYPSPDTPMFAIPL